MAANRRLLSSHQRIGPAPGEGSEAKDLYDDYNEFAESLMPNRACNIAARIGYSILAKFCKPSI